MLLVCLDSHDVSGCEISIGRPLCNNDNIVVLKSAFIALYSDKLKMAEVSVETCFINSKI